MPHLDIHLLGDFRILADNEPVTGLHQPRLQSVLAYLLLHCQTPQSRQHISFLFWSDSTEAQARTNLRKALYHIRQRLPDADRFIYSGTNIMQWLPDTPFTLDVADFERLIGQADTAQEREEPAEVLTHLTQAAELYQGELLPGCYDDWLLTAREQLHQRALAVFERLMQRLEQARDYAAAIHQGQRLLALDPLHEATYRRLMRLHALNGDRAGALRTYHSCADLLQRELDVEPNADTQAVYERLLRADVSTTSHARPPQRASGTRLVGRQKEWRRLQAAWRMARQIQPHFALVVGEAGIGKSHLVEEMRRWAAQQNITTAHARAYAAESGLVYAPVIDWLRSEPFHANLNRLEPIWLTEVARLLPELLEAHPDLPRPGPLTERWQRQRLFEAVRRAILLAKAPLLLVLDDLQWCDGETLEWLHFLLRARQIQAAQAPARLLVAGTARPGEVDAQHPLTRLQLGLQRTGQVTEIGLEPLTAEETAELAMQVAERPLESAEIQSLYQASQGNPLFVVEMVRAGDWGPASEERWDSMDLKAPPSETPELPSKVYAVIESRLVQLTPSAREIARLAATSGRSFTFDLLDQAGELDEDALVQGLDELWQRRIVREDSANAYDFSHDRIRDAAYAEISPVRRRYYHSRIV